MIFYILNPLYEYLNKKIAFEKFLGGGEALCPPLNLPLIIGSSTYHLSPVGCKPLHEAPLSYGKLDIKELD